MGEVGVKRTGVRTRTLGAGWEERFLAAVRRAREESLMPADAAEKLRAFAGAYFCVKCQQEHRTESKLGKKHLRLRPTPPAPPHESKAVETPRRRKRAAAAQATLPEALAEGAKAAGARARVALKREGQRAGRRGKRGWP